MTTTLNKCSIDGGEPVEETRAEVHKDGKNPRNEKETVEMHAAIADDFRIHCSTCYNSTGWDTPDIMEIIRVADGDYRLRKKEGTQRDENKENVRKRWNEMNKTKAEKVNERVTARREGAPQPAV